MPVLKFSVDADLQKVVDMRKEIGELEAQLKSFSPTTATQSLEALTKQLADARAQFSSLTQAARDAGAKLVSEVQTTSAKANAVKVPKVKVDMDTSAFHAKMEALVSDLQKSVGDIRAFGEQVTNTMSNLANLAGWAVPTTGIFAFLNRMKNVRADFQDMESSMKVFLGSAEEGAKFTSKLQDYAWYNMFDFKQLVGCSKQMIAYGHSVDSIIPSLDKLSNVATGTNASLNEMVALYNKAKSIGTVDGEAIQSWALRGVMIKDVLKDMGEKIRNNKVTFEQLDKVLTKVTDKGGMFHGVMDAQMNNISASIGQLQDNTDLMFNALGQQMEEPLRKVIDIAAAVVENLQTWGEVVFATISGPLSALFDTVGDIMDAFTEWTDGLDPDTKEAAVKSLMVAWGTYKLTAIGAEKAVQLEMEETIKKAEELKKKKAEATDNSEAGSPEEDIDKDLLNRIKRGKMTTEEAKKVQDARNYIKSAETPPLPPPAPVDSEADILRRKRENLEQQMDAGRQQLDALRPQAVDSYIDIQRGRENNAINSKQAKILSHERDGLIERALNIKGTAADKELSNGLMQASSKRKKLERSRGQLGKQTKQVDEIDSRLDQFHELYSLQEQVANAPGEKNRQRSKRISELQTDLEGYNEQDLLSQRSELMTKLETDLNAYQASVDELDKLQQQNLERARQLAEGAGTNTSLRQVADNEAALTKKMQENMPASAAATEASGGGDAVGNSEEATDAIQEQLEAAQELTEGLEAAEEAEEELSKATEHSSNASRAHAAGEKADSAAVGANSAANKANAVAQGQAANASLRSTVATKAHAAASKVAATGSLLLKNAVTSVKASFDALKASIISNPIGMAITAISMAWTFFASKGDEADSQTEEFGETAVATTNKVRSLCAILEATTEGSNAHSEAQAELNGLFEKYGIELNKQLGDTEAMIDAKQRLIDKIMEEGKQEQITANIKRMNKTQDTNREAFAKNAKDSVGAWLNGAKGEAAKYTDLISGAITESVEKNADRIAALTKKIRQSSDDKEITALVNERAGLIMGDATQMAKKLSDNNPDVKFTDFRLGAASNRVTSYAVEFAEQTETYKEGLKAMSETSAAMNESKQPKEEEIDYMRNYGDAQKFKADMVKLFSEESKDALEAAKAAQAEYTIKTEEDVKKIRTAYKSATEETNKYEQKVESLNSVLKRISELQEQAAKEPLSELQQMELNALLGQALKLEDELGALTDTEINPKANTIHVDKLKAAIDEAQKSGKAVDGSVIKILTDSTMVDGLQRKLNTLKQYVDKIKDVNITIGLKITEGFKALLQRVDETLGTSFAKSLSADDEVNTAQANVDKQTAAQQKLYDGLKAKYENATKDEEFDELISALNSAIAENSQNSTLRKKFELLLKQVKQKDTRNKPQDSQYGPQERAYAEWKRQEAEERAKEQQERENNNRGKQAQIDAMPEGRDKTIAQAEFDAEKQQQAVADKVRQEANRLEQDALKKWLNGGFNRKEWQFYKDKADIEQKRQKWLKEAKTNVQAGAQTAENQAALQRKLTKLREDEAASYRAFIKKVGTFAERLKAIKDDYDFKIQKAKEGGDFVEAERLEYESQAEQKNAMNEKFAADNDFTSLLSDVASHSDEWLEQMRGILMSKMANAKENGDITHENFQRLTENIATIEKELGQRKNDANRDEFSLLNVLKHGFVYTDPKAEAKVDVVTQAEADVNAAEHNREKADNAFDKATTEYNGAVNELIELASKLGLSITAEDYINGGKEAQSQLLSQIGTITGGTDFSQTATTLTGKLAAKAGELEKATETKDKANDAATKANDKLQNAKDDRDGANDTWKDKLAAASKHIEKINEPVQGISKLINSIGLDDTDAGRGMGALADSMGAAAGAAASFAQGDYIGAITQAIDALGSFGDALGEFGILGGESDRDYEENMAKLTASNEALMHAIQELSEEMQEQTLVGAVSTAQKQQANLEQAKANTQRQMKGSGKSRKNGRFGTGWGEEESANEKINEGMSAEMWKHISSVVGKSVRSAKDFWNLTSEEMYQVSVQAPEAFAELMRLGDTGHQQVSQYINDYISYDKQAEELIDQLHQKLTDTTWENVADGFKSALLDMTSSSETFADNFQQIMEQAVVNSLMANTYNQQIEQWYDTFASMMKSGGLDTSELRELRSQYEAISNDALRDRNAIKEAMGFDGGQQGQSGSSNFSSMSQDTGSELNGRFASMQVAMEATRVGVSGLSTTAAASSLSLANIDANMLDLLTTYNAFLPHYESMNNQLSKMYLELLDIKSNTKAIIEPIKSIQSDIAEVKNHTKRL